MKIVFIIGAIYSGKTIYAKREFPQSVIVNISAYENYVFCAETNTEIEEIAHNADLYCCEELRCRIESAKENNTIVVVHPMLKKKTRAEFIAAVREKTNAPITCIVLYPEEAFLSEMLNQETQLMTLHRYEKEKMETPQENEGFQKVINVRPVFTKAEWDNEMHFGENL